MRLDPATLADLTAVAAEIRKLAGEDPVAFLDTLDGETPALDWLNALALEAQEASALGDGCRQAAQRLTLRARRFDEQEKRCREMALLILSAIGERKVKTACATFTVGPGKRSLALAPDFDCPSQLRKPGDPDRAAIKAQLEAGETIPGAALVTGEPVLTVRIS